MNKKKQTKTYVSVPENTQDVDGSIIGRSGFFEEGRRRVAYFELSISLNGNWDERKKIIQIAGYVVDVGQINSLGNTEYRVNPIPKEEKQMIERIGKEGGLVGKFEFWK